MLLKSQNLLALGTESFSSRSYKQSIRHISDLETRRLSIELIEQKGVRNKHSASAAFFPCYHFRDD